MRKIFKFLISILIISNLSFAAKYQDIILSEVNQTRKSKGISELKINKKLNEIAIIKANDMAKAQELSHTSKKFGMTFELIKDSGIKYSAAAENIARWHETPEFVVERWLKSDGHKKNILNPEYDETGIGMAKDKNGKNYWVQLFIKRKN